MNEADCDFAALDFIAITNGPGSFTGLRIGVAVAQGLAFAHRLPVLPLSTLRGLAYSAYLSVVSQPVESEAEKCVSSEERPVLALLDARMNQVYAGWYLCNSRGAQLLGEERVISPADIDVMRLSLDTNKSSHCIVAGSGLDYESEFPQGWRNTSNSLWLAEQGVSMQALSCLALKVIDKDFVHCVSPSKLAPEYIRNQVVDKR